MYTFYVTLERRWKTSKKRWESVIWASRERPQVWYESDIAKFEVEAPSGPVACAIVTEWLYKGRPSIMIVTEIRS